MLRGALPDERTCLNTLRSKSRRTHDHIQLSHLRLPQPGGPRPRIYIPQEQGGPVIPPGTGFPFSRLLRLVGLRWSYSNPPQLQVQAILRLTVSRSVRLGVVLLLEPVTRCYIYLSEKNYFLCFSCRALSLTRGRVCNLQFNDASSSSSSSYIATDGLSASLS
jgi:hypothetical protein